MTNKRENYMITGGATGIGFAAALMYLEQGAKVVIAGRSVTTGNDALSSLQRISKDVDFFATDVSDPNSVQALINHTVYHFGRLDIAFTMLALMELLLQLQILRMM
jgi:NAD(P)-dependent dehydrogenase (short-subunit alcohol dehydrogenase family)